MSGTENPHLGVRIGFLVILHTWTQTLLYHPHVYEFLRRFLLHVLPDGFVRIRSYGLLANRCRRQNLVRCREVLGVLAEEAAAAAESSSGGDELLARLVGSSPCRCPQCGHETLIAVGEIPPAGRGPPEGRWAS